ncbi:hypothetical protein GGH94_005657 [Coemansia aciculifera]|uniref:RlpA-like protein double-psi beta-barrel domain-containing protein n=1 Tax=Coemansia aciculifera TaxID=417176 RepID=A0A9W8IJM1_9FUNG|nr:hypothetical protein GGH94_005657 [Coemansia aciculifera]KAJ2870416.1 hypothetical protein GGH93_005587 [Coemansia aciculifera]
MKFAIASLLIAATLVSATAVEQNQACSANYVPLAGADNNVVVVTKVITVTAGAKRPASSVKPTTIHSNGKVVITEVKTVTAGGKNEAAAGNGVVTPASQAPVATDVPSSQAAEIPVAQNSPTAAASPPATASPPAAASPAASPPVAASVPAKASSSSPPAASPPPAQTAQASPPAQTQPAASQAPQPTQPAASQAPQPTSGNTGGNTGSDSFTGDGTFFSPGLGSCGLTNSDSDLIAAIPAPQYGTNANPNNAEVCGKCALVKGPKGQVKVKITDRCPVCKTGDLDLSPSAFQQIGDFDAGRIPISWSFVAC